VPCLDGTRTDIINQIHGWIGQNCDRESPVSASTGPVDATANSRIFWINGSAGTGKTTIAYTVAKACNEKKILGASFFCSRDDAACTNPNFIFTTIAYQLGYFCHSFGSEVAGVLKSHPDIAYSDLPYQLEQLIINPLLAIGACFPPCVVVIDALDECKDDRATSLVLDSLSRHVDQLSSLKILITSRPERNITTGFESSPLNAATQRFVLHEVRLGIVENDIKNYLAVKLATIRKFFHLHDSWPSMTDVEALSRLSSGLFIFAATSIKFIGDSNYGDPAGQLVKLLHGTAVMEGCSPHRHLNELYMQVLNQAYPDISLDLAGRLKLVMGSIILLRDPLSAHNLERLLNMNLENVASNHGPVRTTLIHLHSVVIIPEDDTQVIRLLHPSFFDFLIDPDRCQNTRLVVNTEAQHTLLAEGCLHAMRGLRRNMCGNRSSSRLENEVGDLSTQITRYIPPHIQYACRHWASHLACAMVSDILIDLLKEFCSEGLLYWVEVCSLLGDLRSALLALDNARRALAVRHLGCYEYVTHSLCFVDKYRQKDRNHDLTF
jgi:NACHT domain